MAWMKTLTVGVALACNASLAMAQQNSAEAVPASAQVPGKPTAHARSAEFVEETPVDGDVTDAATEPAPGIAEDATPEVVKERFPNGSIKVEREVTQDTQGNYVNHGSWKMWDQRGNPVARGQHHLGHRSGTWTRWYRAPAEAEVLTKMPYQQFNAPFISQAQFKAGELDGLWTIYDGKMRKISQIRFVDGKRNGTATWFYANGHKMREAEYRDSQLDGTVSEWAPDGKPVAKDTYQAGRKLAAKKTTHPNGARKSEGVYLFPKETEQSADDWWNCKMATYVRTGPEEKHGPWISWYSNGQPQLEGNYDHDTQNGRFQWWHANGQKAQEGRYDHGKQDGAWTWWFPSGQKSIRGEYASGVPAARWTWWKEDGKVVQSADLTHSEGIVIDSTPTLEGKPPVPRTSMPTLGRPTVR